MGNRQLTYRLTGRWGKFLTDHNDFRSGQAFDARTSYTLLNQVLDRQADAWVRMVRLYTPLVMRWCRQWGAQIPDAENVCQEVFRAVYVGLATFEATDRIGSFRAWLRAVTKNKLIDQRRAWEKDAIAFGGSEAKHQFQQIPETDEYDPAEASNDIRFLYRQAVELIRSEFSERDWQAFFLVTVQAHTPAEAANALDMTVNSVYLAKSRIIKKVKEDFGELIGEAGPAE